MVENKVSSFFGHGVHISALNARDILWRPLCQWQTFENLIPEKQLLPDRTKNVLETDAIFPVADSGLWSACHWQLYINGAVSGHFCMAFCVDRPHDQRVCLRVTGRAGEQATDVH